MSTLVEVKTEYENEYVYSKIQYDERHGWRKYKRFLDINNGSYFIDRKCVEDNGYNIISFEEFKSRYGLKIGDTFEKDGFVCEVKEKIKEQEQEQIKSAIEFSEQITQAMINGLVKGAMQIAEKL